MTSSIRQTIGNKYEQLSFKQTLAHFNDQCTKVQTSLQKIWRNASDAHGYDSQYQFHANLPNPLKNLGEEEKKAAFQNIIETFRQKLATDWAAELQKKQILSDPQEFIAYMKHKMARQTLLEDPKKVKLKKFDRFLEKLQKGAFKTLPAKLDSQNRKLLKAQDDIEHEISSHYEQIKRMRLSQKEHQIVGDQLNTIASSKSIKEFRESILKVNQSDHTALCEFLKTLPRFSPHRPVQLFQEIAKAMNIMKPGIERIRQRQQKIIDLRIHLGETVNEPPLVPISAPLINALCTAGNMEPFQTVAARPSAIAASRAGGSQPADQADSAAQPSRQVVPDLNPRQAAPLENRPIAQPRAGSAHPTPQQVAPQDRPVIPVPQEIPITPQNRPVTPIPKEIPVAPQNRPVSPAPIAQPAVRQAQQPKIVKQTEIKPVRSQKNTIINFIKKPFIWFKNLLISIWKWFTER